MSQPVTLVGSPAGPPPEWAQFVTWKADHKDWVENLWLLQRDPWGFSFSVSADRGVKHLQQQAKPVTYKGAYLAAVRKKEMEDDRKRLRDYQAKWWIYLNGRTEYLTVGRVFHRLMADPKLSVAVKKQLMEQDEKDRHLFHNAAVLWLEAQEQKKTENLNALQDYEEVLKWLWLQEIRAAHGWSDKQQTPREAALVKYLLGRHPFAVPTYGSRIERGHTTLGKIIRHRPVTDPTAAGSARLLPAFWGLFLFSPVRNTDRGHYNSGAADAAWLKLLATWRVQYLHPTGGGPQAAGSTTYQVHERVPRPFTDLRYCPPGVYLHRTNGHGRDEFLVTVTGGAVPTVVVSCIKGVGADPALISAAKGTATAAELTDWFTRGNPKNLLPFNYPAADKDLVASSWRNLGFCTNFGGDEVASVDFDNFATLYDHARARPQYGANGFVEPYACVEISCVARNVGRLSDGIKHGVKSNKIGWPVELVTIAPRETSLRLAKKVGEQSYDYGFLPLEVVEWSRVAATPAATPGTPTLLGCVQAELNAIKQKLPRYQPRSPEARRLADLEVRYKLAAGLTMRVLAHWLVFLDRGWASGLYTGSFAGRNFNSGPRDSNDWGPLCGPSELAPGVPSGHGPWRLHVDLGDLCTLLAPQGELLGALELLPSPDNDCDTPQEAIALGVLWPKSQLAKFLANVVMFCAELRKDKDLSTKVAAITSGSVADANKDAASLVLRKVKTLARTHLAKLDNLELRDVLALVNQLPDAPRS